MDESTSTSGVRGRWPTPSEALARSAQPASLARTGEARGAAVRFGYRVGSLGFLVGRGVLSELLPKPATYPIPNVPAALRGFVNRQGALVPVWDLHVLLDAAPAVDTRESILLLGRGESRLGLVIDGLPHALRQLEQVSRLPAPPEVLREYVQGAYIADGALWLEFDCEALLRAQAQQAMT
jgi:chemotaxis signal transduction protein